ncbi:hypothetical protein PQR39_41415 [Paraburkholderia sediminicola]|uniref:hypothetical protein n=1 Tax=Paraburkholderia sediminicola TaxID=458836 RepID=UPI0038B8CBFE
MVASNGHLQHQPDVGEGTGAARSAFTVQASEKNHGEILFTPVTNDPVAKAQLRMQEDLEDTARVLRNAIDKTSSFDRQFEKLIRIANLIFSDGIAQLDAGSVWLDTFKKDATEDLGIALKRQLLMRYSNLCLCGSIAILVLALIFEVGIYACDFYPVWVTANVAAGAILVKATKDYYQLAPLNIAMCVVSVLWGMFVSLIFRWPELKYDDLPMLKAGKFEVAAELVGYGFFAVAAMLILISGSADVSLGNYHAKDLTQNTWIALFVGFGLGLSHRLLPNFVNHTFEGLFRSAQERKPESRVTRRSRTAKDGEQDTS